MTWRLIVSTLLADYIIALAGLNAGLRSGIIHLLSALAALFLSIWALHAALCCKSQLKDTINKLD
jgi:hypothetical protein